MQTEMLIGSTLREGHRDRGADPQSARPARHPRAARGLAGQIDAAVAAAEKAFATWSRTTPAQRSGYCS